MKIQKLLKTIVTSTTLIGCLSGVAQADIWNINSVEMGTDGGFGFSGFHYSGSAGSGSNSGSNVMNGSSITNSNIDGFIPSGTYNDDSGEFNLTLVLDNGNNSVDLSGTFNFSGNSILSAVFGSALSLPTFETLSSTVEIGFLPGQVCCGGDYAPNGFYDLMDGTAIMSLWGSSWGTGIFDGSYIDPLLGMDLRLTFTKSIDTSTGDTPENSVPEPSSIVLFSLAFIAFGSSRSLRNI